MEDTAEFKATERRHRLQNILEQERTQFDEQFRISLESIEFSTDELIAMERTRVDDAHSLARGMLDLARSNDGARDDVIAIPSGERLAFDLLMIKERNLIDRVIARERTQRDRISKESLQTERETADRSIRVENVDTDLKTTINSEILSTEKQQHELTRSVLRSRDEFLAIVSHDLRGPLGAITMSADLLLDESRKGVEAADLRQWIGIVKRSAATMLRLISDLLDLERINSGKVLLHRSRQDAGVLVAAAIEPFRLISEGKGVALAFHQPDVFTEVICDGDRFNQVISNLVGNAIKYTPKGGRIEVAIEASATGLSVTVSDTGPGIPKDSQEKIFERFGQVDSRHRDGLGLGLYISKWIVEAHGGKIWVESPDETGSVFHVSIPAKDGGR